MLESLMHPCSTFITLTYNDSHLPSDGMCSKRDIQLFLRRLRQTPRDYNISLPPSFRYYISCEYGTLHGRPHYHGILFGIDCLSPDWLPSFVSNGLSNSCVRSFSRARNSLPYAEEGFLSTSYPLFTSKVLERIWSHGYVTCDRASSKSIRYVSKYITKQGCWSLQSMHIGLSPFCDIDGRKVTGLTHFGASVFDTSKVSYDLNGSFVSRPPRCLTKYVEKFCPDLHKRVSDRTKLYLKNLPLRELRSLLEVTQIRNERENQKRKYDNEN